MTLLTGISGYLRKKHLRKNTSNFQEKIQTWSLFRFEEFWELWTFLLLMILDESCQQDFLRLDQNSFVNRYRWWLETCSKAKTSKSGHAITFSFFRRVQATSMTQHRVENTRVHFRTFSPSSVNACFHWRMVSVNTKGRPRFCFKLFNKL